MRRTPLRSNPETTKAWQDRSRRNNPLKPGGPIKPNAKRKAANFAAKFESSEFVGWIHGFPCAICGDYGWTEAAHVKRRSQGGKAENNIVPLCGDRRYGKNAGREGCHTRFDKYELEDHRMRLGALAKALWAEWKGPKHV